MRNPLILFLLLTLSGCAGEKDTSNEDSTAPDTTATSYESDPAPAPRQKEEETVIRIEAPGPDMDIHSPLTIRGEARGYWFFEGDFKISLVDYQGNELATAVANAQGAWMTEEFVPFEAEMTFESPDDERGYLIFHKANPSGLPENDREYRLPVIISRR